jgi:hypothetical protein
VKDAVMAEIDLHDPEWLRQANDHMRRKGCPSCGSSSVEIAWKYIPTGGSLAGQQLKVSAIHSLVFECSDCNMHARVSEDKS